MRINAPQLFNGEILASQKWIADQLSGLLPNYNYDEATETFTIGELINSGMIIKSVYGDTILIDNTTDAKSIKEYIETVSGDLYGQITTGVKLVDNGGLTRTEDGIKVVPSDFISFTKENLENTETGFAATYTMTIDGNTTKINIPKDQFLKDAKFVLDANATGAETTYADYPAIKFTFDVSSDGVDGEDTVVWVPVKDLFQEFTAGKGLTLTGTEFSIVKDTADDSKFLTIGDKTIGLTGITDAIAAASGYALNTAIGAEGNLSGDNTIYGAKAYADEKARAAQAAAETTADTALNTFKNDTYTPFTEKTTADISAISGVIGEDYDNESTIDERLSAVEGTVGIGSGTGSLTDRMTQAEADIDAIEADIADIRTKAVEFFETTVSFGGETSGTVNGRVIAVFDSTGVQCYPTIAYADGTSTLTAATKNSAAENFTVIWSTVITPKTETE